MFESLSRLQGKSKRNKDLAAFYTNLSFLLSVKFAALEAVTMIYESGYNPDKDKVPKGTAFYAGLLFPDLTDGYSLSEAMSAHPEYFGAHAQQVRAGELTDKVEVVLNRIAVELQSQGKLKSKIRGALTYPVIVMCVTVVVTWYLFSNVMPNIMTMLTDAGATQLPAVTVFVMGISESLNNGGSYVLLAILALLAGGVFCARKFAPMQVAELTLRMPLVGKILQCDILATYYGGLEDLIYAGTPMDTAMDAAANAIKNPYMRKKCQDARRLYVDSGESMASALTQVPHISRQELQTIAVGVKTGRIEEILSRLKQNRADQANTAVDQFVGALNPILIIIVGLVIGLVALSVYSPLINISRILN